MKYALGFPAVAKKDTSQVILFTLGIERQNARAPKKVVRLKDKSAELEEEIRPDRPFAVDVTSVEACLDNLFSSPGKTERVSLTFSFMQEGLSIDTLIKDGQINISPASAGCALSVLGDIEKLVPGGEDYFIQITARVSGEAVRPLNDTTQLIAKAKRCLGNDRTALILHQDDMESLKNNEVFREWLWAEHLRRDDIWGTPRDFSDAGAFAKALESGKRLFPLPVDAEGFWLQDGKPADGRWTTSLSRVLQFPLRNYDGRPERHVTAKMQDQPLPKTCALATFLQAAEGNEVLSHAIHQRATGSWGAADAAETAPLLAPLPPENLGNLEYLDTLLKKSGGDAPFWTPARIKRDDCLPNIIISGPTGCGKTLLSQALLVNALGRSMSGIYVGPTRALVEEVYARLKDLLPPTTDVILSTGEATDDDWRFHQGNFDIACLVTEKANVLLAAHPQLMERIGCVVIDEIHMLASADRGGTLDMLMAKIMDTQAKEDGKNLRMVVASTELPTDKIERLPLYTFLTRESTKNLDDVPPLVVASDVRPHTVRHQVRLYCGDEKAWSDYELGSFASQSDRHRDDAWYHEHYNGLLRKISPEKWAREGMPGGFGGRAENALIEHILGIAANHTRTIVVDASKGKINQHAENTYKKRKQERAYTEAPEDPNARAAADLQDLLEEGELPGGAPNHQGEIKSLGATMVEWAALGVYIHHADIPRKARNIVEEVFRTVDKCHYHPIVFCTETLSYGVNLRADAVILCELHFPRSDADWRLTKPKSSPLTATEYHNMLGRVGRFTTDSNNDAFIFINMEKNPQEPVQTLLSYYSGADNMLKCQTFNIEDIRKFDKDQIRDLDDITFSSFSTVMDALRMAQMAAQGRAVSAAKVRDMLDFSFFMGSMRANAQSRLARAFEKKAGCPSSGGAFVDTVLGLTCKKIFRGNIHLVSKTENENGDAEYSLEKAAALIDTGMHWSNVAPMARWIARLKALYQGAPVIPMELFLPALLACPKVYNDSLRTAFVQFQKPTVLDPGAAEKWRENMRSGLKRRLGDIFKKMPECQDKDRRNLALKLFLDEVSDFANAETDFQNAVGELCHTNKQHYMPVRDILFLAMLAISLDWLNGERQEMYTHPLNPLLSRATSEIPAIPGRLFELMAWSAQMCANFFPEPTLSRADKGQLSRLVARLRKGVPLAYLPLAQATGISANQILKLGKAKISCEDILRLRGYPPQKKTGKLPDKKVVLKAIRNFYIQEYSKLERRVAPKFTGQLKKFMEQFLKETRQDWKEAFAQDFAEICGYESNSRLRFDEQTHVLTILEPQAGKEWRVALTHTGDPEEGCGAVCYLPWRPEDADPPEVPVFTPGSLFAACHFLERTRTSFGSLLEASGRAQVISFARVLNWSEIDIGQDALAIMEPFENFGVGA